MRLSVYLLLLVSTALSITACGDSDSSDPEPPQTTSRAVQELRSCVDADPGDRTKAVLTEGKPAATKFTSGDLKAYVPGDVLDQALAAGGYLRIRYDRKGSANPIQVGAIDVLALGTSAAAKSSADALRDASISKKYTVVQVDTLLLVYPNRYEQDRGDRTASRGVRASTQRCLAKIGSTVRLPAPKRVLEDSAR